MPYSFAMWFKTIFLFIFSIASLQPLAIASIESNFYYLLEGGFRSYENPLEATEKILKIALEIAEKNQVEVKRVQLATDKGPLKQYPALQIIPAATSKVNQIALEAEQSLGGLPLIFSPYDLKRSQAKAFFDPNGSKLGVSSSFIENKTDESFYHELIHAKTYLKLLESKDSTFAGWMELLKGSYMSAQGQESGYRVRASLDEILSTEYSLQSNMQSLYQAYKKHTYQEFLRDRSNEKLLEEIKFSLDNLVGMALTAQDLLTQVLQKIDQQDNLESNKVQVSLGPNLSEWVFEYRIKVNSIERNYGQRSGSFYQQIPEGSLVVLRDYSDDITKLKNRLKKLITHANQVQTQYKKVSPHVGLRILYADLPTTNIENLYQAIFPKN